MLRADTLIVESYDAYYIMQYVVGLATVVTIPYFALIWAAIRPGYLMTPRLLSKVDMGGAY